MKTRLTLPHALRPALSMLAILVIALAVSGLGATAMAATAPGVGTDSGLGPFAAIGCGLFGRALVTGMVFPGVIAGAIAMCGFMFIDAFLLN